MLFWNAHSLAENIALILSISFLSFILSYAGASIGLMMGQLRLPLLVLWLGSPLMASGTNLAISSIGALSAFIQHLKQKNVDLKLLLVMGVPSGFCAFLFGSFMSKFAPEWIQTAIGFTLLCSAFELLRKAPVAPDTHKSISQFTFLFEALLGGILGALAGTVGLMMGTLRLSSLISLFGINPRVAIGTNLGIGCITGIFGALGVWSSFNISWPVLLVAGFTTIIGAKWGAKLTLKVEPLKLKRLVAVAIAFSALIMIAQGLLVNHITATSIVKVTP